MKKAVFYIKVTVVCIILFSFHSNLFADSKYTRENSEALFHLIQWHDYTRQTFQKAVSEQKPVFLVLSAPAWCYWCHVYESEDYLYHPDLYPYINDNFIAIFIDSDRRPDLTKKYMEGGWPSTVLLTPDLRRIDGFSGPGNPQALKEYLVQLVQFLKEKSFTPGEREISYEETKPLVPEYSHLDAMESLFLLFVNRSYDPKFGGFILGETEQKFPTGLTYKFLLEKYEKSGNTSYLDMVQNTFDNSFTDIARFNKDYRLYDPVEGGFHRYSTKSDWTAPHYEKLLGDQARLLTAYAHLFTITGDRRVKSAVDGTIRFVRNKLYDENGGFYASQDAYLEHGYYGLTNETRDAMPPPYVDRTRVMDSNAMMTRAFLYVYKLFGNPEYVRIARQSLEFIRDRMVGANGAYYYFDYEKGRPFLTGQAVSNAWSLLLFLDGYDVLGDRKYLHTAERIAEYSFSTLYDWNSGGFFERNSEDTESYAPGEQLDLTKPYMENAVFSFAMLRLYLITGELTYLDSGLKTLGRLLVGAPSGLDEYYFFLQASNLVKDNNLLAEHTANLAKINAVAAQGKSDFFLTKMIDQSGKIKLPADIPKFRGVPAGAGLFVLALMAFAAGILSFLSPCTLPILPAYFAQSLHTTKGEIARNTLFFFFGLATVFSLFGMGATMIGGVLRDNRVLFTQTAAIIIIIFGAMELFGKGFSGLTINLRGTQRTPVGSYLFGAVFAFGWSACIGPVLASFLILAATSGTVIKGTSLLFIYALGLAVPLLFLSLFFDRVKYRTFWKVLQGKGITVNVFGREFSFHSSHVISGILIIALGVLIYHDYLYKLNLVTFGSDYVQDIIIKGEEWLRDFFIQ